MFIVFLDDFGKLLSLNQAIIWYYNHMTYLASQLKANKIFGLYEASPMRKPSMAIHSLAKYQG